MGVIGYTGYYYLQESNTNMKLMYTDRLIPVKITNEVRTNVVIVNAATLELMITTDDKKNQELKKIIDDIGKKSNDSYAELEKSHLDS
jgi:methyl-accepting chemotaxis protein